MIALKVNGELREIPEPVSILGFLEERGLHERMVVVEHNLEIVPRDLYANVQLADGDNLEIVQMMAGG